MLQEMVSSHDQHSIDDITSPLSAQIFDFCDSQLFQETFQVSEVTSDENSAYNNILEKPGSFQENNSVSNIIIAEITNSNNKTLQDVEDNNNNNNNNTDLSIIFDSQEDFETDIAASIDFSSSSLQYPVIDHLLTVTNQDQFDFSGVQSVHDHQAANILYSGDSLSLPAATSSVSNPLQLSVFEEDCLSSVPSYNVGFNSSSTSCSFFRAPGLPAYMAASVGNMNTGLASESSGFFSGNVHLSSEIKPHDQLMDFQADNGGLFCTDSIKRIFNPGDLQGFGGGENQTHMVTPQAPPQAAEITGLEDSTFSKVGKLTVEQRKEKIHRYMKKRNERNFSKKIKYACRKTLADSRPRVRGRFAKNDEFGEPNRQISLNHHDDEEEDDIGVKEEDSTDIFSHISGANSFKCNYSIQSWI